MLTQPSSVAPLEHAQEPLSPNGQEGGCPFQRANGLPHITPFGVVLRVGDSEVISPYLLPREAACFLRTTLGSLHKLIQQRRIPHTRRGDSLLFDVRKLTAWLETRERGQGKVVAHHRGA